MFSRWLSFVCDYVLDIIELCFISTMYKRSAQKHSRDKIIDISKKSNGADNNILNIVSKNIKKRTLYPDSLEPCLLPYDNSLTVESIKRAELLLPYKTYKKTESRRNFLKQLDIRFYERYKIGNTKKYKILQESDDTLRDVRAVTDFDGKFFNIVNGRPLSQTIPLYKSVNTLLTTLLRIRQEAGYKNDCILNIESNFRFEKKIYDISLQRFTEQAKIFDKYIMEDYKKSMKLLQEGENLNAKLDAKMFELQNLADNSFIIMSRLIGLDYKYCLQQRYGRFLYYLSPPIWRSNNREFARSIEIEAKGFDFGNSNVDDTFTVMFEKMRYECLSSSVKPVLYFTHPQDLINVFNGMEKQQLYHFCRETQLAPHSKCLKEGIQVFKEKNTQDSTAVTASITGCKNLLYFCEARSTHLKEQFFKVLNGFFYETVCTPEVLKLIVHLEFCFDKVFCEKPMNMDIVTMAKAMETMYFDYSKRLDAIQGHTVRRSMKRCMDLDRRKIVKAKFAAKELRLFYRLEKELLGAHNLLPREVNVQCRNKDKLHLKGTRIKSRKCNDRQQSLTRAEIEYLTFFTDWTEGENPVSYLQSFRND